MYQTPAWQYIASPRNHHRYVQSLKAELNTQSGLRKSLVSLRPKGAENGQDENDMNESDRTDQFYWMSCKDCVFPENCVLAADYVAVARAFHQGKMIPGKVVYGLKYATIPVHYKEVAKLDYEVLVKLPQQKFIWKRSANGIVPKGAVPVGQDLDGEELYIGRAKIGFEVSCGKVKLSHNCAYLPFGGHTTKVSQYEVLCLDTSSGNAI